MSRGARVRMFSIARSGAPAVLQDRFSSYATTAATGAHAEVHREVVDRRSAARRRDTDVAFGDCVADADVHGQATSIEMTERWPFGPSQ